MKGILLALIFSYIACKQITTVSSEIFSEVFPNRNLELEYFDEWTYFTDKTSNLGIAHNDYLISLYILPPKYRLPIFFSR